MMAVRGRQLDRRADAVHPARHGGSHVVCSRGQNAQGLLGPGAQGSKAGKRNKETVDIVIPIEHQSLNWAALHWTGQGWTGLDWTGPDWIGLD